MLKSLASRVSFGPRAFFLLPSARGRGSGARSPDMTNVLDQPSTRPLDVARPPAATRPLPLACKICGARHPASPIATCEECLGPLEPVYDPGRALPDAATIAARPRSLWRYHEWLPFDGEPEVSLDSGFTPLLDAPALA